MNKKISFFDAAMNVGIKDFVLRFSCEEGGKLAVKSTVRKVPKINAVVVCHAITNTSAKPVRISEVATVPDPDTGALLHGKGGWMGWDLRYCHTDNVRTEHYPYCQMEYPYVRMLPNTVTRLGAGEDQPFPALCIRDEQSQGAVVFAAASQALNYITFDLHKDGMVNEGISKLFAINHDSGQSDGIVIPAGKTKTLDGIFIQILHACAWEDVFKDYVDYIASRFTFRGQKTSLVREAFHCTWNYGVYANQREDVLLPTARSIAKNFPKIKWFLMDAGYLHGDIATTFLDRFYPDPEQHMTTDKWPNGIRGYVDELKKLGLRPGIWWSPTVRVPSSLHDDHPDWFVKNKDGSLYLIGGKNAFLDYTHPEALAFLDRTLKHFCTKWGMEAFKMDFWSQNFEDRHIRLYDDSVTAVEARTRFFKTVRRHLPKDGIFMTCVAVGMGNPFIGEYADTYRNTIDIGAGTWHEQVRNCIWALPMLFTEGRKTFLLNNDSIGINLDCPDNENYFRLTWGFINMGMQETGGQMEKWPAKWVKAMRKLTDRCDRGYRVHCPDTNALTGIPLPEVLSVDYPKGSPTAQRGIRQSVALFNWSDEPKVISILRSKLGHDGSVTAQNFWTDKKETLSTPFLTRTLPPRSALLYDIL